MKRGSALLCFLQSAEAVLQPVAVSSCHLLTAWQDWKHRNLLPTNWWHNSWTGKLHNNYVLLAFQRNSDTTCILPSRFQRLGLFFFFWSIFSRTRSMNIFFGQHASTVAAVTAGQKNDNGLDNLLMNKDAYSTFTMFHKSLSIFLFYYYIYCPSDNSSKTKTCSTTLKFFSFYTKIWMIHYYFMVLLIFKSFVMLLQ